MRPGGGRAGRVGEMGGEGREIKSRKGPRESGSEGGQDSLRGDVFSTSFPRSSLGTRNLSRSGQTPSAPSLNSATEPPGGGATLCCPRRSPRHLAGAQVTRAFDARSPRGALYPFPEASLRGRLGVGQLGPSRGPEQKQLSDFYSAQHGTGKCLGGWITGPGANQGSPKIPKAAADTASESV